MKFKLQQQEFIIVVGRVYTLPWFCNAFKGKIVDTSWLFIFFYFHFYTDAAVTDTATVPVVLVLSGLQHLQSIIALGLFKMDKKNYLEF